MVKNPKFEIELKSCGLDGVELDVSGSLDAMEIQDFHSTCRNLLRSSGPGQVVLNFDKLSYIDSSGIGALMVMKNRIASSGQALVLKNCNGDVMRAMKLLSLQKLFVFL